MPGASLRRPTATRIKILVGLVEESPLDATVSAKAVRSMLGLCEVSGDVILAAPASRVDVHDVSGFALQTDKRGYLSAHRVLLLVKGTSVSQWDPIEESAQSLTTQSFRVSSPKVQCLLSDVFVNLYGYYDISGLLRCRLGQDVALVLASAVDIDAKAQLKNLYRRAQDQARRLEIVQAFL